MFNKRPPASQSTNIWRRASISSISSITQPVYGRKKDFAFYVSNEFSVFIKAVYTLYLCV